MTKSDLINLLNSAYIVREASGSGSTSSSGSGWVDPCDLGDGTPVDATNKCNKLAQIEGNSTYTQEHKTGSYSSASGRYQFTGSTAEDVLVRSGQAPDRATAKRIWTQCRNSSNPSCKSIQDKMCNFYSEQLSNSLKKRGIPVTQRNLYLAWNQGAAGADIILKAAATNSNVTDKKVAGNMMGQAWIHTTNANSFLRGMEGYMRQKGVDP